MYQAGVSEKLIQQRTGHRSLDALRKHERTSDVQLLDVCNVISGNRPTGSNAVSTNAIEYKKVNVVQQPPPSVQPSPTIIFTGCNFTGCSINISAQPSMKAISEEVLSGLSIDDIFDD